MRPKAMNYLALAGMNRAIFDAERAREQGPAADEAKAAAPQPGKAMKQRAGIDDEDDDAPKVPPDGQWHEDTFAGGRYAVRMTDEGGRISLNRAREPLLTRVITNLLRGGNHDIAG